MVRFFILLLIVIAATGNTRGQDTLFLMSGRMKTNVSVMHMDSVKILYVPSHRNDINKQGRIPLKSKERQNVFEIRYEDGTRELAYIQDSSGYIVTPEQARAYVYGCHDAFLYSHNRIIGPACFAVTLSSFMFLPPVAVIAVPGVFSAVTAAFTPDFPADRINEEQVNKYYILGYQDTRKIKKVKSAMFFGIGALITGFSLHYLFN